jgi:hypothetical protein
MPAAQRICKTRSVGITPNSENNPTHNNLPFLTKRQKLRHTARARILENLHLFTFLRTHAAERFFALACAASTQSRANPFGRLGGVGRDHFQPHNRQRFAPRGFGETALFSASNGEQAVCWRISESVDSAQLTQTSALTPFRPVPRVRILRPPPCSLKCREIPLALSRNTRIMPAFRDYPRQTGLQRTDCSAAKAVTVLAFLRKAHVQSGFKRAIRRMECDQKPGIRP